jgi:hypothetical protein
MKEGLEWRIVATPLFVVLFLNAATLRTGGESNAKAHDDVDCRGALAGHHGHAGQRTKPAARRRQHPRAQERNPDRYAGGVLRRNRLLRLRPRLGQRVRSPLLSMCSLLVSRASNVEMPSRPPQRAAFFDANVPSRPPGLDLEGGRQGLPRTASGRTGGSTRITSLRPNRVEAADD